LYAGSQPPTEALMRNAMRFGGQYFSAVQMSLLRG
jgi:hypothetical protein